MSDPTLPVTAVAFDFGGVLTYSAFGGLRDYERELGLPTDTLVREFRDGAEMARLEVGETTARDFFKHVCVTTERAHGQRLDIRRLAAAAGEGERLNPAMLALVEQVRRYCPTALVTNNVAAAGWRGTFPFELFSVVIDSSDVGVRKPDPAIYLELLRRVDRRPEQVAFVDDLPRNVDAAAALGIAPILFTDEDACRAELVRLGALPTHDQQGQPCA
ncbi:HAD family hydrolase [Pseudonocardia sp. Cha107L01]|uniref:HAD family hydrolase n=1 Tax=Pseudonocardia sp. Cha107L01 TaxID=3457576 RepID=UPI00403EDFFA